MEIQFLGAARTVTGSMHHIEVNGNRLLLDRGLFQGRRDESYQRNKNFPFDPSTIQAVVLSHAHTVHAGNLPNLVRSGFRGPIYATSATRDLCNVMLYDGADIKERLKGVFLVHGELAQAEQLLAKLKDYGISRVHIPERGEKAEFPR